METRHKSDFEPGDRTLVLSLLGPPVVWLSHLTISYTLAPSACALGTRANLHLLSVVAVVITLGLGVIALRHYRHLGEGSTDGGEEAPTRRRFMAIVGMVFSIAFTLSILATEIANVMVERCG